MGVTKNEDDYDDGGDDDDADRRPDYRMIDISACRGIYRTTKTQQSWSI
jgi:hypothetical protein